MNKNELLNVIEGFNKYEEESRKKHEQRVWKKIDPTSNLKEALTRLTKNDLDEIRRNLDLKNLSSLKKGEFVDELVKLIPVHIHKMTKTLDQGRYQLIKLIIQNGGTYQVDVFPIEQAEFLYRYSLAFSGTHKKEKILVMPAEIRNAFLEINEMELKKIVKRNTEWILLTQGMLYYYGVMDTSEVIDRIEQFTGATVDTYDYFQVMSVAKDCYKEINYSAYGFQRSIILNPRKVAEEHKMRANVDFYPFTKEQLLKAGVPGYLDKTPAMKAFFELLLENYDITTQEVEEIAIEIHTMINNDATPPTLIKYLESILEFPTFEFVQELTENIMTLHNQTRMWSLKGNCPNDLAPKASKPVNVLQKPVQRTAKVVDIRSKKIGRNQPCPCGSGKKYKKCCGK